MARLNKDEYFQLCDDEYMHEWLKKCSKCNVDLTDTNYNFGRIDCACYLCDTCYNLRVKKWRDENPDKEKLSHRNAKQRMRM